MDLWQQRLIVNKVYDVSNFKVLESEQRYSRIRPGKYQINFDKWTKCDAVGDSELIPNFPVLNWQLKSFSEIQTMNPRSEEVIIVDIFGLYVDCSYPGISENQQMVMCNELGGKRVIIDKIQLILGQLGNYKEVLVKGKTILRLKGIKMWSFETPLQADVLTSSDDCLPLAFKEWLEEIFDSDDENNQEKDLLKEIGLKESDLNESDLKESDLKEIDLKERELKEKDLKQKDLKQKDLKQKDLKQKDLEGKKDQLSEENN
uniref:Uncharacterized protein n=1 Tax=Daphnia galeata TaxID=27404 RepID=A0A8J2RKZ9_9CRUS|nr:unnamed protein product [Daphnia galeata]